MHAWQEASLAPSLSLHVLQSVCHGTISPSQALRVFGKLTYERLELEQGNLNEQGICIYQALQRESLTEF